MGGETIFKPFVLLFTIIALMVMVVVMVQHTQISATNVLSGVDLQNAMGEMNYTLIDPQGGIVISSAKASDHMVYPKDAPIVFTDNGPDGHADKKYVQIIIGNQNYKFGSDNMWEKYPSFISVQRQTHGFDSKWNGAAIPIQAFIDDFDYDTNQTLQSFYLSSMNDTVFLHLMDNNTARIWNSNYTMYYGWATYRTGHINFWSTISLLYTAHIPGMNPTISMFVAVMFWAVTLFMLFTMISRIVPFISGG